MSKIKLFYCFIVVMPFYLAGQKNITEVTKKDMNTLEIANFGAGCFWCVEAVFLQAIGVEKVESGYMGGKTKNPTYKEICTGNTNHAEIIQISFDTKKITFEELLEIFWQTHDPTTLNKQGNDSGTQYRSVVFFTNETQKNVAERIKKKLDASGAFEKPIVTEISPASQFYKAEEYHQNYYHQNGSQPYCYFVIKPKVEKFKKVFSSKLKK